MIFIASLPALRNSRWGTADMNFTRMGFNCSNVQEFLALWFYLLLKNNECPSGGQGIKPSRQYLEMFTGGIACCSGPHRLCLTTWLHFKPKFKVPRVCVLPWISTTKKAGNSQERRHKKICSQEGDVPFCVRRKTSSVLLLLQLEINR